MSGWAAPRRVGVATAYVWHVRTLDALSRGDFDAAYRCASAVSPAGQLASHVPNALWLIMELVEAAARSGRPGEAAAHIAAARDASIGELSPRLALILAGATAMAAPDRDHRDLFERALRVPDADRWPFDRARIQLAYGERLWRTQSVSDARTQLTAALDTFRPWAPGRGRNGPATSCAPPVSTASGPTPPATRALPRSSGRSLSWPRPACPTSRSPNGCFFLPAPSATTCTRSFRSSASPPAPRCATRWPYCRKTNTMTRFSGTDRSFARG